MHNSFHFAEPPPKRSPRWLSNLTRAVMVVAVVVSGMLLIVNLMNHAPR